MNMHSDQQQPAGSSAEHEIVRAVLNLGLSLGKTVNAEGIETVEQLTTQKKLGVPVGQGYLLSRPSRSNQVQILFEEMVAEPA